jgi:2-polyprenyl-6-hydroxyphenyl methylase / 3-demethylubiquinone-9 3-methyltransferase
MNATTRADEIAKFDALAARWWDPDGPMRPLHRQNPLRTGWIIERIARMHGRDPTAPDALEGLSVLDLGCGAGLAAEVLARRGARVTGLDASAEAIAAAQAHAAAQGLEIDYQVGAPEDLAAGSFDVVTALEVIEHVADRESFAAALAARLAPGGIVFVSTLNRTARSLLLAKLGAEYVLRWLPRGTHNWRLFVTPGELAAALRPSGLRIRDIAGMVLDPIAGTWRSSQDVGINYITMASR